jgi:hypothetical protein
VGQHLDFFARSDDFLFGGAGNFACCRLSGGALAAAMLLCGAGWQPAADGQSACP